MTPFRSTGRSPSYARLPKRSPLESWAAKLEAAPGKGHQPSLSKAVRNALANDGTSAAMDECAWRLLPDQAE